MNMSNLNKLINEEIAKYKWYRGEENIQLSWEDAEKNWMTNHYNDFINSISSINKVGGTSKKRIKRLVKKSRSIFGIKSTFYSGNDTKIPYHTGL